MTFAASPARAASMILMASMACSISSSLIALTPPLCSTFISRGTSKAQTFKYAAGDSRRTRLNTSRPCCCQSSARSSRKRLLNARRVASGDPPGFPVRLFFENTDGTPPLRHFTVVLNLINRPAASLIGIFTVTLNTGDFYGEIFPISSLDQIGPELSDGLRAIDRLHARRH